MTIIEEDVRAAAEGIDQQVEVTVAIDIGKDGPGRFQAVAGDTGGLRHFFKPSAAQISIEGIGATEATEIEIAPAIAIDITGGHAGAIDEDLVEGGLIVGQEVGELNSGNIWRQQGEAGMSRIGECQWAFAKTGAGLPFRKRWGGVDLAMKSGQN